MIINPHCSDHIPTIPILRDLAIAVWAAMTSNEFLEYSYGIRALHSNY